MESGYDICGKRIRNVEGGKVSFLSDIILMKELFFGWILYFLCINEFFVNNFRFLTQEDCLAKCKDSPKPSTKNCEKSAPTCDEGCKLTKDNEGACLKCECEKGKNHVYINS